MPIKLRLAVFFAAATAVIFSVISIALVLSISSQLKLSLTSTLRSRADILSQVAPDSTVALSASAIHNRVVLPTSLTNNPGTGSNEVQAPGIPLSLAVPNTYVVLAEFLNQKGQPIEIFGSLHIPGLLSHTQSLQASKSEITLVRTIEGIGPVLVLATPTLGATGISTVVGAPLRAINKEIDRTILSLIAIGVVLAVVSGLGAWLVTLGVLRPVTRMRLQAEGFSSTSKWSYLEIPKTRDEVADLALTLNQLLRRIEDARKRERGFVASAGHELRTPLSILQGELELALMPRRSEDELRAAISSSLEETVRLTNLTQTLLLLAQSDEGTLLLHPSPSQLRPLLTQYLGAMGQLAAQRSVALTLLSNEDISLAVDESAFRQVMFNLLDNAIRYSPSGQSVDLSYHAGQNTVEIHVVDHGEGFPTDFISSAFERFSRSSHVRERSTGGNGLGLSIVKVLMQAMNGDVSISNSPVGGADITLHLPLATPESRINL